MSLISELEKLCSLRADGTLSEEDFELAKKKLLNRPNGPRIQAPPPRREGGIVETYVWFKIVTGVIGAWLAKQQGMQAWGRIQQQLSQGKSPSGDLLDGVMILLAAAVWPTTNRADFAQEFMVSTLGRHGEWPMVAGVVIIENVSKT